MIKIEVLMYDIVYSKQTVDLICNNDNLPWYLYILETITLP